MILVPAAYSAHEIQTDTYITLSRTLLTDLFMNYPIALQINAG